MRARDLYWRARLGVTNTPDLEGVRCRLERNLVAAFDTGGKVFSYIAESLIEKGLQVGEQLKAKANRAQRENAENPIFDEVPDTLIEFILKLNNSDLKIFLDKMDPVALKEMIESFLSQGVFPSLAELQDHLNIADRIRQQSKVAGSALANGLESVPEILGEGRVGVESALVGGLDCVLTLADGTRKMMESRPGTLGTMSTKVGDRIGRVFLDTFFQPRS